MARYILRAPDAELRALGDYRHHYQEYSYTETVDVVDGIAKCNDEPTKDMLTRKGYNLVDPELCCKKCLHVSLDPKEFDEHAKVHAEKEIHAEKKVTFGKIIKKTSVRR